MEAVPQGAIGEKGPTGSKLWVFWTVIIGELCLRTMKTEPQAKRKKLVEEIGRPVLACGLKAILFGGQTSRQKRANEKTGRRPR